MEISRKLMSKFSPWLPSGKEKRTSYSSVNTMYVCMVTYRKSMDQPGKDANPTCGQPNRENEYFPVRVRT